MNISENLKLSIEASLRAGEVIMEIYNGEDFAIEIKDNNSPLTKADKAAHEIIKSHLSVSNYPILSEEGAQIPYNERKTWNLFWMVDPIDGTKEFIKRNGEFTVNIALIKDQRPVLGVVYTPVLKHLYFAEEGFGSFKVENISILDDLNSNNFIDLKKTTPPDIYTLVVSKSHMNLETQEYVNEKEKEYGTIKMASFGSSLKICKVAEGSANCYPRFGPTMEWDTAAAHAIAFIANCIVTKTDLITPLIYNKEDLLNPYFIIQENGHS
ncbi:MAG: 3(2),5-bisphosphate nucleotidase CysQ [Bacteroidota bacterium]|jgi:3'(2'), 5'-bisphosphate nucleotidase